MPFPLHCSQASNGVTLHTSIICASWGHTLHQRIMTLLVIDAKNYAKKVQKKSSYYHSTNMLRIRACIFGDNYTNNAVVTPNSWTLHFERTYRNGRCFVFKPSPWWNFIVSMKVFNESNFQMIDSDITAVHISVEAQYRSMEEIRNVYKIYLANLSWNWKKNWKKSNGLH